MKTSSYKSFIKMILILLFIVFSMWKSFAAVEDTSIIDELNKTETKDLNYDFNLKSFESCDGLESVMGKYIKDYWKNNKNKWDYPMMYDRMALDTVSNWVMEESAVQKTATPSDTSWDWVSGDYSKTNVQVAWVDESDIVKTDWKYIYYYNETDRYVYIVKAWELEIIKKIKLPSTFYAPVLYISENRLIIVSGGFSDVSYTSYWYWIDRNNKTYTVVFDTTNIANPVLTKLYSSDWDFVNSRMIGDYVYIISNNNFSIPFYSFKTEDDIVIDANKMLPKKIDISKTNVVSDQNLNLRWKKLPYNVTAWNISKCEDIEYVLPDSDTLSKFDFSPSYNIVSTVNIKDTTKQVKTKVIAWSNAELYMSLDNLYMTSYMYKSYDFRCSGFSRCFAPWYPRGENTLVHKINISGDVLKYQDSTIIPWTPLTQYSMDEYKTNFRILTQTNTWNDKWNQSHTDLYILDKDLKLKWQLNNLWEWEQFRSSRYIWDKLFLVTFKQTDPLFAIDVAKPSNPKILWELKIPGYSTYLHPYDENHLIWLWYDTKENEWGGTINNGIKVDLYEVNYDKKCWDTDLSADEKKKCDDWTYKWIIVKQLYTKTLGEYASYSEALYNPRMFMWKASNNKLFLPVTLYNNYPDDIYRHKDFFQWLVTLNIDKDHWIAESYRITHLNTINAEKERLVECSKYTKDTTEKRCVDLIWWWQYCEDVKYNYVPKYCYADSTVWEYIASKSWEYNKSSIKRALWIGNTTYTISDDMIRSSNMNSGVKTDSVLIWK